MIDALGFKGMWGKMENPAAFVADLASWSEQAMSDTLILARSTRNWFYKNNIEPEIRFLSDTVFVGLQAPVGVGRWMPDQPEASLRALALRTVMGTLIGIMRSAAKSNYPLVYRGALAYGNFAASGNFLIGPAIDEAAELHETAEGGIVYLTPSALKLYESEMPGQDRDTYFIKYNVPVKGGLRYQTRALNPMVPGNEDEFSNGIMSVFDRSDPMPLRVALLKQNTSAFLDYCKGHVHSISNSNEAK